MVLEVEAWVSGFGKLESMRDLVPGRRDREAASVIPLSTDVEQSDEVEQTGPFS